MANHKSALKRARQTVKRNEANRSRRASTRALTKVVENAVAKGDVATATAGMKVAEKSLAKSVSNKTLHWRTAARKTSRLAQSVKKVALAAKA